MSVFVQALCPQCNDFKFTLPVVEGVERPVAEKVGRAREALEAHNRREHADTKEKLLRDVLKYLLRFDNRAPLNPYPFIARGRDLGVDV